MPRALIGLLNTSHLTQDKATADEHAERTRIVCAFRAPHCSSDVNAELRQMNLVSSPIKKGGSLRSRLTNISTSCLALQSPAKSYLKVSSKLLVVLPSFCCC